jgi:hypothetical protein
MAYKQSPFPMIEGTSPVKQLGLIKHAIKYGIKGAKYLKKTFSKSKTVNPKKNRIPMKNDHYGGMNNPKIHPQTGNIHFPKGGYTYPGMHSVKHPGFLKHTSKQLEASHKYWFNNPLKK